MLVALFAIVLASQPVPNAMGQHAQIVASATLQRDAKFDATDGRDRAKFALAMSKLDDNDSTSRVIQLLGRPDRIVREGDDPRFQRWGEVWCYGGSGQGSLPVLGCIVIEDKKVSYTIGDRDNPPAKSTISESALRKYMRLLDATTPNNSNVDPLFLIQLANTFGSLEKDQIIAILSEYERIAPVPHAPHAIYWLANILFEVPAPEGFIRTPAIGAYGQERQQGSQHPRFPVILVDDIPFAAFNGVMIAGAPELLRSYLKDLSKLSLRTQQLRPTDDPFATYEKLISSPQWPFADQELQPHPMYSHTVLVQLLWLVRTAYVPEGLSADGNMSAYVARRKFDQYYEEFKKLGVRWDSSRQVYVRADGKTTSDYPVKPIRYDHSK